jgi:hypothetical protein
MKSKKWDRDPNARRRMDRFDLAFRALLVAALWLVLYLLGAQISQVVVVTTVAAIFGPDVLRAGFDRFSDRVSGRR